MNSALTRTVSLKAIIYGLASAKRSICAENLAREFRVILMILSTNTDVWRAS